MDLISAKVEAAAASKKNRSTIFINVDGEGECVLAEAADDTTQAVFKNGNETKAEEVETTPATPAKAEAAAPAEKTKKASAPKKKQDKKMATTATKKAAPAKAAPAKKASPAKAATATKKKDPAWKSGELQPRGCNMFLTPSEWKKVDAILAKEELSFNAWAKGLIRAKLK